jgi:hypothetical protein
MRRAKMRKIFMAMGLIFVLLITISTQSPAQDGEDVIHGCVNIKNGNLRVVSSPDQCRQLETSISWNQTGPEGPQGECDCPITQEQLDDLIAKIEYLARFLDMGDGTIRDNATGLIWLKNANTFGPMSWNEAMDEASNLSNGEYGLSDGSVNGDWRLPTKEEWEMFVSPGYLANTQGYVRWSEGDPFTGVQSGLYWSSTEFNTNYAWGVYMIGCNMSYVNKDDNYYVWPVRSAND